MTDKYIEKIKKSIRSHRAKLVWEKRKYGEYEDDYGRRFLIAELYFEIRDFKGALRYYNWFEREFPCDNGLPSFNLCWSVALFENREFEKAKRKVYKTAFLNTYLFDVLLGRHYEVIDKNEFGWWESLNFAVQIKGVCEASVTENYLIWLKEFTESEEYKRNIGRFIALNKLIKDEEPGTVRSELIYREWELEEQLTSSRPLKKFEMWRGPEKDTK